MSASHQTQQRPLPSVVLLAPAVVASKPMAGAPSGGGVA